MSKEYILNTEHTNSLIPSFRVALPIVPNDKLEGRDDKQAILEWKASKVPEEFWFSPDIGRESEISTEGVTMEDEWGYKFYAL